MPTVKIDPGYRTAMVDGTLCTYSLECREPKSLISVGRCGDDATTFTTCLHTKISSVGPCILDEDRLTSLILALTQFRDQIKSSRIEEERAKRRADELIKDHSYLSAGDNPRASGDIAYRGCSRVINGSICGRSRKEHAK